MAADQSKREFHSMYVCVVLWIATRLCVIAAGWVLAPNFVGDELALYEVWGKSLLIEGGIQGDNWQYPPLVSTILISATSSGLMPWTFIGMALAADAAILALLIRLAVRGQSWSGAWFWAVGAVIIGPAIFAKLDIFPAALALLAIALATRPALSGIAAGIGTVLKIWPAFVLVSVPRSGSRKALIAWACSSIVIGGACAVVWPSTVEFATNQQSRGLQIEAVAALPLVWARSLGVNLPIEARFGSFEFAVPVADVTADMLSIGLLAVGLGVLVLWVTGRLDGVPGAEAALTAVLISLILSRVLSPQFNVWTVALCAILLAQEGQRARVVVILISSSSVLTQLIYAVGYEAFRSSAPLAVVLHTGRIALLVAATLVLCMRVVRTWRKDSARSLAC